MKLRFDKMTGAGNDFVLLHSLPQKIGLPRAARRLCDRQQGVGADGLLVLEKKKGLPRLIYFNADGSAAFCGNGSRCAAWWMFQNGWMKARRFSFQTSAGLLNATVTDKNRAAILMPAPRDIRLDLKIKAGGKAWKVDSINTGVPHAVVEVRSLDSFPVASTGALLRRHPAFAPQGANIDFIEIKSGTIRVRTFERGVEGETLACGTGAVAAALVGAFKRKLHSPIAVQTRGADVLTVSFDAKAPLGIRNVWLEGPAKTVFKGEIEL